MVKLDSDTSDICSPVIDPHVDLISSTISCFNGSFRGGSHRYERLEDVICGDISNATTVEEVVITTNARQYINCSSALFLTVNAALGKCRS